MKLGHNHPSLTIVENANNMIIIFKKNLRKSARLKILPRDTTFIL